MTIQVERIRPNIKAARRVAFDHIGEWDWSDDERVSFTSDSLGFIWYRIPQGFGRGSLTLLHPEGFTFAIGVYDGDGRAWRFQSSDGRVEPVAHLFGRDRIEDGFHFIKGFANEEGMAVVYETGLLFFDRAGELRWRQDDLKLDWEFMGLDASGVLFKDGRGK